MSEELILKERLQGLMRVLPHNPELAVQIVQHLIEEIDEQVQAFEEENAPI